MLELALTHPTYRQNIATFAGIYIAAGAVPVLISVPFAIKQRQWRSLCWIPTWFAYAVLRRLATLEAAITLPVRPFPAPAPARIPSPRSAAPAAGPARRARRLRHAGARGTLATRDTGRRAG
jgi:hypothetical protein